MSRAAGSAAEPGVARPEGYHATFRRSAMVHLVNREVHERYLEYRDRHAYFGGTKAMLSRDSGSRARPFPRTSG